MFTWDIAGVLCCSSRILVFRQIFLVSRTGAVVPELSCLCLWLCRRKSEQTAPRGPVKLVGVFIGNTPGGPVVAYRW